MQRQLLGILGIIVVEANPLPHMPERPWKVLLWNPAQKSLTAAGFLPALRPSLSKVGCRLPPSARIQDEVGAPNELQAAWVLQPWLGCQNMFMTTFRQTNLTNIFGHVRFVLSELKLTPVATWAKSVPVISSHATPAWIDLDLTWKWLTKSLPLLICPKSKEDGLVLFAM